MTIVFVLIMGLPAQSQLVLSSNGSTPYTIVIPENGNALDQKAATVLQRYLKELSGVTFPIATDAQPASEQEICVGKTQRGSGNEKTGTDGFIIRTRGSRLFIYGASGKSTLYGVYHFLDEYLGCRKFTAGPTYVPKQNNLSIPSIEDTQVPQLTFRNVYYPDHYDEEFRDWHKLHTLEEQFGLWGHTFDKLVPPSTYFSAHPEYYALVNGQRSETQLCLSNSAVFGILTRNLDQLIRAQPERQYWSVSQNDGFGYCTCKGCQTIDNKYGGPQGSVINFVNKVAAKFPGKTISTLAYLYSARPPVNLKPASNVSVMLSSISIDRGKPVATNPRTALFRSDIKGWSAVTKNLMIWDYVVQFTNYQSPFPNLAFLQDNMNYFASNQVNGVFIQGTEGSTGEFSALKTYLLAKSAWDPKSSLARHKEEFLKIHYGAAATYLAQYLDALQTEFAKSNRLLDIYGDPVSEWNTWLTPDKIEKYSDILDKASDAVEENPRLLKNVLAERLALDYAVIQQARFYGLEKHGLFIRSGDEWSIRSGLQKKVQRFLATASASGVKVLSEGGHTVESYTAEWEEVFRKGPIIHEAIGSEARAIIPFSTEYPGKGIRGITDGSRGYENFQYNYLGWYGTDLEVVIDLGKVKEIGSVSAGFLEDQRHWSFLPLQIVVELSADNISYRPAGELKLDAPEENYEKETHRFTVRLAAKQEARYIRVKAKNLLELPKWRNFPNRKSWLFCDEIAVFK